MPIKFLWNSLSKFLWIEEKIIHEWRQKYDEGLEYLGYYLDNEAKYHFIFSEKVVIRYITNNTEMNRLENQLKEQI